jgi:hypothetical protein
MTKQYPPRDAAQSLDDQLKIHNHNIENGIRVMNGVQDPKVMTEEYLLLRQKTKMALVDYMLYGSHENYSSFVQQTVEMISSGFIQAKEDLIATRRTERSEATSFSDFPGTSQKSASTQNFYFGTALGEIPFHTIRDYKDNPDISNYKLVDWHTLAMSTEDQRHKWIRAMLDPLDLNPSIELSAFGKLPLENQYTEIMNLFKLSVAISEYKVSYSFDLVKSDQVSPVRKIVVRDWKIEDETSGVTTDKTSDPSIGETKNKTFQTQACHLVIDIADLRDRMFPATKETLFSTETYRLLEEANKKLVEVCKSIDKELEKNVQKPVGQ